MVQVLNSIVERLNEWGPMFVDFVLTMSLQLCIVFAMIGILDILIFRKLRATIRYAIWLIVLIKLLLPVTLESPIGVGRLIPAQTLQATKIRSDIEPTQFAERLFDESGAQLPSRVQSFQEPPLPLTRTRIDSDIPGPASDVREAGSSTHLFFPRETNRSEPGHLQAISWQGSVLALWTILATILSVNMLRLTWRIRSVVRHSEEASPEVSKLLANCQEEIGVRSKIKVVTTDELPGPAIFGLWRPTILVPTLLINRLTKEDLRFVFLHELSHFKRHDLLVSCMQTLVQIFYFFHPLVWITNHVLRNLREKAVDEFVLATAKEGAIQQYSNTLVNVATTKRTNPQLVLSFSGIQTRSGLANRITSMLIRPIPKRTGLGLMGLLLVIALAAVLIPTAPQSSEIIAAEPIAEQPLEQGTEKGESEAEDVEPSVMIGTISDEERQPVTDAKIQITHVQERVSVDAKTDKNGQYAIPHVAVAGAYRMKVESKAWVGITRWRELPIVNLVPGTTLTKNVTLRRACQIQLEIVDEKGDPIDGVSVMAKLVSNDDGFAPETVATNAQGRVTLSGLRPENTEYLIATMHSDYGFGRVDVLLNDPTKVVSRKLVLQKGKSISGNAVCSDGHPPAGWRILAMPTWWNFGRSPMGQFVKEDGSFTLPHIVDGEYDVSISIPRGKNGSSPRNVLKATNLARMDAPIAVQLDHPSPQSLVSIEGKVEFDGLAPPKGFWIFARSTDNDIRKSSSIYVDRGETEFQIGPVQAGRYELRVSDTQAEAEPLFVKAPTKTAVLRVRAKGKPRIAGVVVDAKTKGKVDSFRVQLRKRSTLRGPNFVQELTWHHVRNDEGQFDLEVVGPGIYEVVVAADGYRWEHSAPINTDSDKGKPIRIELQAGVSFSGTVVDEGGKPVDGATVIALSKSAGTMPRVTKTFVSEEGAVRTKKGKFKFQHLSPGLESFKVTHPDYCFTVQENIEISDKASSPVQFVLKRGGIVTGHVYDENGVPRANATVIFHDRTGYGGSMDEEAGRLATAVTDENGYYQANALPEQLCYVHLQKEWKTRGVVRHCVLPKNGETITLDFGGMNRLRGRLVVNGTPEVGRRMLISGSSPHFGIFKAYAVTKEDGEFEFRGLAPGNRTLYYLSPNHSNVWVRIRDVSVPIGSVDLGDIQQRNGKLFVRINAKGKVSPDAARASLITYDPVWSYGRQTGVNTKRNDGGSIEISEVPVGRYELTLFHRDYFQVRKAVEVTPDNLRQKFNLDLPVGTATLSGKVNREQDDKTTSRYSRFEIWSVDRSLRRTLMPTEDGTFEIPNVPAGEYFIVDGQLRDMEPVKTITVKDGENLRFDLTQKATQSIGDQFYLVVRPYFKNSPFACNVHLSSSNGEIRPRASQYGRISFMGKPGEYEIVAEYPGMTTIRRPLQLEKHNSRQPVTEVTLYMSKEIQD